MEWIETRLPVSKLRIGMQVTRLDRPWLETDFPVQGFLIRSPEDLEALRERCEYVYVEGQMWTEPGVGRRPPRKRIRYINPVPMVEELDSAMACFHQCRNLSKQIFESVRLGRVLDMSTIRPVVRSTVASVLRNHNALLWLTNIKRKDEYTAEHSMNVCMLSAAFGKHLGLNEHEIEVLALSGLLHDVGKVRIDDAVLNKPGAFTPEEFAHMKEHPVHGKRVLMSVDGLEPIAVDVAHTHHERIDGGGYPRALEQHQIPYFAKIVAVVDAYDAITSNRLYDQARASKQALDILYKCRAAQFDDELVLQFIQFIGIYPPGAIVELSTGEVGIVLDVQDENRLRPRVLVVRDRHHQPCRERILDLLHGPIHNSEPAYVVKELPNGALDIDLAEHLQRGLRLATRTKAQGTERDGAELVHAHYRREADVKAQ